MSNGKELYLRRVAQEQDKEISALKLELQNAKDELCSMTVEKAQLYKQLAAIAPLGTIECASCKQPVAIKDEGIDHICSDCIIAGLHERLAYEYHKGKISGIESKADIDEVFGKKVTELPFYKQCCEDLIMELAKLHRELKTTESALELQVAINRKLQKALR